jgi:hypothetical protein
VAVAGIDDLGTDAVGVIDVSELDGRRLFIQFIGDVPTVRVEAPFDDFRAPDLVLRAPSGEEPNNIDGFPAHISPLGIGDEPEWVPVAGPEEGDYFSRESDLDDGEAGVYDRDGNLVGRFGECPGGGGSFVELGEEPTSEQCSPTTVSE